MKSLIFLLFITLLSSCSTNRRIAPIVDIQQASQTYSQKNKGNYQGKTYSVKRGDTLYSIAWQVGVDFRRLATINQIKKPYQIFPGQVLKLAQNTSKNRTNTQSKQALSAQNKALNTSKKTVANGSSGGYVKPPPSQGKPIKTKTNGSSKTFPSKVRSWRYPSNGKIIGTYSTKGNSNKGLDFGGKLGDSINAAADGKVVYAGNALRGYGNLVIVKHNNDYLSAYAHNQAILVKEKDWVKSGQVIAKMGKSGTDKVHLHFEIRFRGRSVNPQKYLPKR